MKKIRRKSANRALLKSARAVFKECNGNILIFPDFAGGPELQQMDFAYSSGILLAAIWRFLTPDT